LKIFFISYSLKNLEWYYSKKVTIRGTNLAICKFGGFCGFGGFGGNLRWDLANLRLKFGEFASEI